MSAQMLVVRNDKAKSITDRVLDYVNRLKRKLGKVDGYYGSSAWLAEGEGNEVMVLVEFREDPAGHAAMESFGSDKLALDQTKLSDEPSELTVFDLDSQRGVRPADAPTGAYLSLSRRVAAPGFGEELESELDSIFGYLDFIPGCIGHIYGSNATLSDQVLGVVIWADQASFWKSVPDSTPYELKLFRKIL